MSQLESAFTVLPRDADTVFKVARELIASEYRPGEVRSDDRTITFTDRGATTVADEVPFTYRMEVEAHDAGAVVGVACTSPHGSEVDRAHRRRGRKTAGRVLGQVIDALETEPASASETERFGRSRARHRFLARLTGRRAGLAAAVLLVAYLVPLGATWAVTRTYELVPRDWPAGVVPTVALIVGLGLVVALTMRFGGWFRGLSFGEEYPVTFAAVPGWLLGWLRFGVQLGALILVCFISFSIQEQADLDDVSNAETRALESYAQGVPVPPGWVAVGSGSVDQNTYAEEPNATFRNTYLVPGTVTVSDVEAWLGSPRWANGDGGTRPIGALRDITCDADSGSCAAEVTSPPGEPAEYVVETTLGDASYSATDRPELTKQVMLQLTYEEAAGAAG